MNPSVITILPRLPPAIDGVGDYGTKVALHLRDRFNTNFVVGDQTWQFKDEYEFLSEFLVNQVAAQTPDRLLEILVGLDTNLVLLHYVGYGYAKRGCPLWLVQGLERWRRGHSDRRLVTMFHELYATPTFGTSTFLTSPIQKYLFTRLANLSDRAVTSRQSYADKITTATKGRLNAIPVLPIFSNVGEPAEVLPLAQRQRRLVIFGAHNWRSRAYQFSLPALTKICQDLGIVEIIDIGRPLEVDLPVINGTTVSVMGIKSAIEISELMAVSMVGFFDYPFSFLGKSGVFAAYCAHGVLPVGAIYPSLECLDGLEIGKHIHVPDLPNQSSMNLAKAQAIADHAHTWYKSHQLSVHAQTFSEAFVSCL